MPKGKRLYRTAGLLAILIAGYSCSVEKNTNLSRFFHNLTSQYNIYFNGYESFEAGMKRISDSNIDDYATIMPIFEYDNPDAARSASQDMDRAVQKCSKLISMHSMTAKPERKKGEAVSDKEKEFLARKDYNNWVDDSYLLIGKAYLIEQNYDEARKSFLLNIRESPDIDVRNESSIWLARTNSETGNFNEATRILNEMRIETLGKDLLSDYYLTRSDIQIKQGYLEQATAPLENALENIRGGKEKPRLTFILARLYEETGNTGMAELSYRKVLKLRPEYELEFNARINQAGVFDVTKGDADEISKELNKLLKDAKNKEYQDQIYYALGNLSMREGKTAEGIEYIKKSAATSTSNTTQKGRSYLMLAEYYFKQFDYTSSQVYYDSATTFLSEDYPGYKDFYERSLNLNELAGYLNTISREDSLRYVASLSAPQRESLIASIIQKIEQEERLAETQIDQRYNMGEYYENQRRFQGDIEASGKWYFYNQSALTFGRSEFRNRWGSRKLEDNWRRINKSRVNNPMAGENQEGNAAVDTVLNVMDNKSPEFYLKDLPLTDSLVALSHDRSADALFNAGRIFQERIPDPAQAQKNYDELISSYPDHPLVPQVLYNLYQLNKKDNPTAADRYKARLIDNYPTSDFALILSDPDYYKTKLSLEKAAENLYNDAFNAWKNDDMELATSLCNRGINEYPDNDLAPKFLLLKAYATARSVDQRTLKENLAVITGTYPGTPEAKRASELIDYINTEVPELKVEEDIQIAREIYSKDTSGVHYFIVVLNDVNLDINRLTFDVINFNIDNYTNNNYSSKGELFADKYLIITVGPFKNSKSAIEYYDSFNPETVLKNGGEGEKKIFIISSGNLETLRQEKDPEKYYLFFRENYLSPQPLNKIP